MMDMIPVIDLRLLTQAELNTLALSSSSSSSPSIDFRRCGDDVIVPKIDRSVFNESTGSRKQTYSRLRLAPPKSTSSTGRRRGRPRSISLPTPDPSSDVVVPPDDAGRKENEKIVLFLRQLFAKNNGAENIPTVSIPIQDPNPNPSPGLASEPKKRGRKKKRVEDDVKLGAVEGEGRDEQLLDGNDLPVDLIALGRREGLFRDELAKRTAGMKTEAEFLEFMNGLGGEWGSRRRRRKIVDAGSLGDGLPKGWKVILGLKRKEGNVWVHCRRYISPGGKQFMSCKDISAYLLSLGGSQVSTSLASITQNRDALISDNFNTGYDPGSICPDKINTNVFSCSSGQQESAAIPKQNFVGNLENSCDNSGKASGFEHTSMFHQNDAKRCRFGNSISSDVIVKSGEFECQFCHKIFTDRQCYSGHIVIHDRHYSQSIEFPSINKAFDKEMEVSSSLSGFLVASEVNATKTNAGKKEVLPNNMCIADSNLGNNGSTYHTSNNMDISACSCPDFLTPDSSLGTSSNKLLGEHVSNFERKNEKLGNVTVNTNHTACSGLGSFAKQLAPESTCISSKEFISIPTSETCSNCIVGNGSSINIENEKLQNVVTLTPSCANNIGFSSFSSIDHDTPQTSSHISMNTLLNPDKVIGEDSKNKFLSSVQGNTNNVKFSSDSEIVCEMECNLTENIDEATLTGKSDDYINKCNVIVGNSVETVADVLVDVGCGITQLNACVANTKFPAGDENIFPDQIDEKLYKIDESSNTPIDVCSSEMSDGEGVFETESSKVVANSVQNDSVVNDKLNNSVQNDTLRTCDGNVISDDIEQCSFVSMASDETENSLNARKIINVSHLNDLSCCWQESTENSLVSCQKTCKPLSEQQLYPESSLSSLPSTMQNYDVQANAGDMEKRDHLEAIDYDRQDCKAVPYGVSQTYGIEDQMGEKDETSLKESVICNMRKSCSNKDPLINNEAVGSNTNNSDLLNTSSLWSHPSNCLSPNDMISNQSINKFYVDQLKQESRSGFQDLKLDDFASNSITLENQAVRSLRSGYTLDLAYNEGLENALAAPVQLEWEMTATDVVNRHHQVTTICMWCGVEFCQESITFQPQSDTIGYICPTCKSKISGQLKF